MIDVQLQRQTVETMDHRALLPDFLISLPPSIASMVTTYHEALCLNYSEVHQSSINSLICAIEDHPVYDLLGQHESLLQKFREGWSGCCARKVLMYGLRLVNQPPLPLYQIRSEGVQDTKRINIYHVWCLLTGPQRTTPADNDVCISG